MKMQIQSKKQSRNTGNILQNYSDFQHQKKHLTQEGRREKKYTISCNLKILKLKRNFLLPFYGEKIVLLFLFCGGFIFLK